MRGVLGAAASVEGPARACVAAPRATKGRPEGGRRSPFVCLVVIALAAAALAVSPSTRSAEARGVPDETLDAGGARDEQANAAPDSEEANQSPRNLTAKLTAVEVTTTSATLHVSKHSDAWHYKQTAPSEGTCSAEVPLQTWTASLNGLSPNTDYTYQLFKPPAILNNPRCNSTELVGTASFTTTGTTLSTTRLVVPEQGSASYTVHLNSAPSAAVTVAIATSGDTDVTADTASLTFTASNFSTAQTVTLAAGDDTDSAYGTLTVTHTTTSTDSDFNGATITLTATEGDNDVCQGTAAVGGATVTAGGLVDDCNTLLGAKAMLVGTSTTLANWDTSTAIASWTGVTVTNGRVTGLSVSNGGLSGMIPNTLGSLSGLAALNLSLNRFDGSIPAALGRLRSLTQLLLYSNSLSGPIPPELADLANLTQLNLSINALSGPIPAQFGGLTNLTLLSLGFNILTGPIPASLGRLTDLTTLRLLDNELSGSIPHELANLTKLTNFRLRHNNLSGCYPASLLAFVTQTSVMNPQRNNVTLSPCDGIALSTVRLAVDEGATAAYTVRLSTEPDTDVTVRIAASGDADITVDTDADMSGSQDSLTFTADNYSTVQTVTLTAGEDEDTLDGTTTITHTGTSTDTAYRNRRSVLTAVESDDDAILAAADVARTSANLALTRHSGAWYFNRTAPSAGTCSSAVTAGTSTELTGLTPGVRYTYTAYSDSACMTALADASFITVGGLVLSANRLVVPEQGTAAYEVRLASAPTATVVVSLAADGDADIRTSTNRLTFTSANYSTAQTVTLSAADDRDSAYGTRTITHTATSSDISYHNATGIVVATEGDDDVCPGTVAVGGAITGGAVEDCNILLGARAMFAGDAVALDNWSTRNSIAIWTGVTVSSGRVTEINLADPSLNGMIPNTFGGLTELTTLDLTRSALTGPIPSTLGALSNLTSLSAVSNDLSGPIPPQLGNLASLSVLNFFGNDLSGPIPPQLGNLSNLTQLNFAQNALSGTIPSELRRLANVEWIILNSNELAGSIPEGLDGLSNLTNLRLYNNNLSGCIPVALAAFDTGSNGINPQSNDVTLPLCAGITLSEAQLVVAEGSSATYTVQLTVAPTHSVNIVLRTTGDGDITADTDAMAAGNQITLAFTPDNYADAQTVTLSAAEDQDTIAGTATISHTAGSVDANYHNIMASLTATESDDDPGLTVTGVTRTGATLNVANHTGAWYYKRTAPSDGTCSAEVTAGTSSASLTGLTAGTRHTYEIYSASSCSTARASVSFTTAGITLSATTIVVPESGTAMYSVRLGTAPTAAVTVTVIAAGDADITPNQSTLTFTTANYETAQTVTLAGANDEDGAQGTTTITHTGTSDDTNYNGHSVTVTATEGDRDVCQGTAAVGGAAATARGLVNDCNILLGAKSALAGTSSALDTWSTSTPMAEWKGITITDNRVTRLYLVGEGLTGVFPNSLDGLSAMTQIWLGNNSLSGEIPETLGNLTTLTGLYLFGNSLSGEIPEALGNLTNLTGLNLNRNNLTGQIPSQLGSLRHLVWLYLNDNGLTGAIPSSLSSLANLEVAWMHSNELSGQIPEWLANLTGLSDLRLNGNRLTGRIPDALGNLTDLSELRLHNNGLSGCVPSGLAAFAGSGQINPQFNNTTLRTCGTLEFSVDELSVDEGATATYTVRLSTAPAARVRVIVTTTGDADISAAPNFLTFTTANYSTAQTITISAAQDEDSLEGAAEVEHTAASGDTSYASAAGSIAVLEIDDDAKLSAINITRNSATLILENYTGDWWLARSAPDVVACQEQGRTFIKNLTGLAASTNHTYTAYSDSDCTSEVASASFTTLRAPAPPPVTPPAPAPAPTPAPQPRDYFADDDGSIFEDSINRVASAGITVGCNPAGTLYCPNRAITRAEMAVFLQRALNLPVPANTNRFEDSQGFARDAIAAIASAGITVGCNPAGTLYCPDRAITRAEMAVFLQRALNLPVPANTNRFEDSQGFARDAIAAIASAGITVGCNPAGTLYCPNRAITRAEMAAFLARALNL